MERKPYVVLGEASESDSEEEVNVSVYKGIQSKALSPNNPQGIIVAGEAPESDEEHEDDAGSVSSISSAASVSSMTTLTSVIKKSKISTKAIKRTDDIKYNTLLHKRLRDRNISLHKNVYEFAHQGATNAARDLNIMNQQLLRSQVQIQEATTAIRALHMHLMQLQTKLSAVTTTTFLPQINTVRTDHPGVVSESK